MKIKAKSNSFQSMTCLCTFQLAPVMFLTH